MGGVFESADRMMILADRPMKMADRTINLADTQNLDEKT
jgi:hypothetical protein